MHTYSYTKILKFYKFRTFEVHYENLQYILLLKNFNTKIQYQKFKEYIMSLRLPDMTSNRNGLLIMAYFRGHSWSFVVTRGHSWSFVVIRGHSWSFVCTFRQEPVRVAIKSRRTYYTRYSSKSKKHTLK